MIINVKSDHFTIFVINFYDVYMNRSRFRHILFIKISHEIIHVKFSSL